MMTAKYSHCIVFDCFRKNMKNVMSLFAFTVKNVRKFTDPVK